MKNPKPKNSNDEFHPFKYPFSTKTKLNRDFKAREGDFLDVLLTRRSSQKLGYIALEGIAELLYFTNKIHSISIDDSRFLISKRTVPSAGGRHPVDILVSMPSESARFLQYYNPIDHSLSELSISKDKQKSFFMEVNENLPIADCCLIWFSIQTKKTQSKYENAESLYWRDAGALIYCIQIVSTYLGFKSCPLGGLAIETFNSLFKTNNLISGGGILIGT
ncbi:nitroreductase family protein [Aequorivita antarctica]|uniref:Nitroreductase domain-containing protein n=1 Tax=Aequorivita antarctica TaxID=153266 RepID=A0A5C6YZX0_9FLAO|nr:nitroreductase family protein [Aequorivita antarctica]TXD72762.1 hypothetical protein ESU54_11105 [Aequorivita antarctica]SRX76389.1 hypothetical protein AEQU3_03389 [Aequorivita antarctica]